MINTIPNEHMLSILSDSIIVFDISKNNVVYMNPTCYELFNIDNSQGLPNLTLAELFSDTQIQKDLLQCPCTQITTFHNVVLKSDMDAIDCTVNAWTDSEQKTLLYCQLLNRMKHYSIDELTGCLQKRPFEELVKHTLRTSSDTSHAMIIVDLDNFKAINDNLGHQFGDLVLKEMGAKLLSLFRTDDYVGRIGGDEFMILMRNTASTKLIIERATSILRELEHTYQGTLHQYQLSASIGISLYPQNGKTFEELYNCADIALFDAKNRGKNAYVFYNNNLSRGTMENPLPYEVATRALSQHFDAKITAQTFHMLFETKDFDISMHSVLQSLGTRFGVNRVYIFENSETCENCYNNTYEWCSENTTPAIDLCQNISKETFHIIMKQSNDDGIVYCNDVMFLQDKIRDILISQDIKSFLHAYICSGDEVLYAIGFDDCKKQRIWSPIEISTLLHVSKIIAQFLNYKNVLKQTQLISDERLSVMDSLNYFSYIIDQNTLELSYFNTYTQKYVPDITLGAVCYNALRGFSEQCPDCPLRDMKKDNKTTIRKLIHDTQMGKEMLVNASKLASFHGKESIFISANDITDIISQ